VPLSGECSGERRSAAITGFTIAYMKCGSGGLRASAVGTFRLAQ
jgi:hypothetical protein